MMGVMPMRWKLIQGLLLGSLVLGSAPAVPAWGNDADEKPSDTAPETETETEAEADADALDPALADLLADLGDEQYATRQRAMRQLLEDEELDASDLVNLYAKAESAEQRHRLLSVARHHTIRAKRLEVFEDPGPVGSIGVYHRELEPGAVPGLDRPAVEIIRPMPGFPAYAHLEPGDLVLAVQERSLSEQDPGGDFQDRIQQYRRGDRLELTLRRGDEEFDVAFRLASRQALRSVYADAYDLRLRSPFAEGWATVRDRLREAGPAPEPLRLERAPEADDAE